MNRYRLMHITEFSYDAPVFESFNEVRLRPMQDERQSCLSFRLVTDPPANAAAHFDYLGNFVHRFNIPQRHRALSITADSIVLVESPAPLPSDCPAVAELARFQADLDEHADFLEPTDYAPHASPVRDLAERAERDADGSTTGFAVAAMKLVHGSFRYEQGATHVQSSIHDTLVTGAGVCQDFAHILLAMLRLRGLPARYVSGYLVPRQATDPAASLEQVIGGQASHAWAEVFIPGAGWIGLDPTAGSPTGVQHVRVAYGRDYGDVAPVRGVYKGEAGQHLSVDVRVRPAVDDDGREHLAEPATVRNDAPAEEMSQQHEQQQQ